MLLQVQVLPSREFARCGGMANTIVMQNASSFWAGSDRSSTSALHAESRERYPVGPPFDVTSNSEHDTI